jgi:hypothetical protein
MCDLEVDGCSRSRLRLRERRGWGGRRESMRDTLERERKRGEGATEREGGGESLVFFDW